MHGVIQTPVGKMNLCVETSTHRWKNQPDVWRREQVLKKGKYAWSQSAARHPLPTEFLVLARFTALLLTL